MKNYFISDGNATLQIYNVQMHLQEIKNKVRFTFSVGGTIGVTYN